MKKIIKLFVFIIILGALTLPLLSSAMVISEATNLTSTSVIIKTSGLAHAGLSVVTIIDDDDTLINPPIKKTALSNNAGIAEATFTGLIPNKNYTATITYDSMVESGIVNFKTLQSNYNLIMTLKGDHPAGSFLQASSGGTNLPNGNCSAENDGGISCTISVPYNTNVKITSNNAVGAELKRLEGDCFGVNVACQFLMNSDKTVIATFDRIKHDLTITMQGVHPAGSSVQVSVDNGILQNNSCSTNGSENGISCNFPINYGANVTLTQTSANDAKFDGWGGSCTGNSSCQFLMNSDKSITATFSNAVVLGNPCTSFAYSNWGTCSGGTQTRTITTRLPVGCTGGNPAALSQSCGSGSVSSDGGSLGLVPCATSRNKTLCGFYDIFALINNIMSFVFKYLVIPIAAIMFAYAGILLLFSGGEASKKTKAKKIFFNVAIGLVIAAAAFLIVKTILSVLGYQQEGWNWFGF
ncbi:MAG: hypothetical protein WC662_03295 [Candidatus Paceibacterota bacterium]|jgi:hypothetical protein